MQPISILVTGFGPFPTAPVNPTERLVRALVRLRRPGLSDVRIAAHVFETSYRAVDRDLPRLIASRRPDAILMFGLAARRRAVTIETRARNAVSVLLADAAGQAGRLAGPLRRIEAGAAERRFPGWTRSLLQPIRASGAPARLSHNAGRYVCNYLCWRALAAAASSGPLVAFVHVPQVKGARRPARSARPRSFTQAELYRVGEALMVAVAAAVRRQRVQGDVIVRAEKGA